jgi:pyroglutamyl-peptidase
MFKVLITGFEPFNKEHINPSELIAKRVNELINKEISNINTITFILPVSFKKVTPILKSLLEEHKPDIAIGLGLWPGITHVTVERVALNIKDSRIPDNDNEQPIDEPIDPNGPTAYFSTLPIKTIVKKLREEKIPAAISNTAGTFLCNYVMYLLLHNSALYGYPKKSGFMHLPFLPEQTITRKTNWEGIPPSMSPELMIKAVIIAIKTTIEKFESRDEKLPP